MSLFTNEDCQYLIGEYFGKKTNKIGEQFKYDIISNPNRRYGQVINNLIATQGRFTIRTNWEFDWHVNDYIKDQFGKMYMIAEITKMPQEVNAQVLNVMIENPDTDYVLSLVETESVR